MAYRYFLLVICATLLLSVLQSCNRRIYKKDKIEIKGCYLRIEIDTINIPPKLKGDIPPAIIIQFDKMKNGF